MGSQTTVRWIYYRLTELLLLTPTQHAPFFNLFSQTHIHTLFPPTSPIKKHKSPIHQPDFVFIVNPEALFLHTSELDYFPYFPIPI